MDAILFFLFGGIAVICGVNLVLQSHPISSALSLVGVMGSLAALYLLLGGAFIAAAQLIVYAGAIMVLFVFVIMLLNAGRERKVIKGPLVKFFGIPLLVLFAGVVGYIVEKYLPATETVKFGAFTHGDGGDVADIGKLLFRDYLLPFEATSVLILIAIIGAIVLARKEIQ
jgi:NADH-quinone oxidoreductase subunit J